jgi:hypothetical protein
VPPSAPSSSIVTVEDPGGMGIPFPSQPQVKTISRGGHDLNEVPRCGCAPASFGLVLVQCDDTMISWRTATFPPQWVGTDIRWEISGGDGASTVAFRHGTFADETEQG